MMHYFIRSEAYGKGDDMKEHKFKVGDKVRYVKEGMCGHERYDWTKESSLKIGDIVTVEIVNNCGNNLPNIIFEHNHKRQSVHPGHFELVSETKFKVGDRVRYVKEGAFYGKDDGLILNVKYKIGSMSIGGFISLMFTNIGYYHNPDHFELVVEQKFKVGDKVSCVKKILCLSEGIKVGETYEIDGINIDGWLEFKNMRSHFWHHPGDFELVREFKVGDSVKYIEDGMFGNDDKLKLGEAYKIIEIGYWGALGFAPPNQGHYHSKCHFVLVEELTEQSALEWSIKKWEYIVENDGSYGLTKEYPIFNSFNSGCGLCEYHCVIGKKKRDCSSCPLHEEGYICCKEFDYSRPKDLLNKLYTIRDKKHPKYKVGDKYIATKDFCDYFKVDDIVEIQLITLNYIYFENKAKKTLLTIDGFNNYFKPYKEPEYKIGDKLICTKDFVSIKKDDIVKIIRPSHDGYDIVGIVSKKESWLRECLTTHFKPLDKETEKLIAIKGSIKKWEDIRDGKEVDKSSNNCSLCIMYNNSCPECPIYEKTKEYECIETPYIKWIEHHRIRHYSYGRERANKCSHRTSIAQEEVDFLKSLLPKKKITFLNGSEIVYDSCHLVGFNGDMNDIITQYIEEHPGFINTVRMFGSDVAQTTAPEEKKLSLKEAIDLSVKKWEWIVKHDGKPNKEEMLENIPELDKLDGYWGNCGLCCYYKNTSAGCGHCPLKTLGSICNEWYSKWARTQDKLKYAVKLLNAIYKIREDYEDGKYE